MTISKENRELIDSIADGTFTNLTVVVCCALMLSSAMFRAKGSEFLGNAIARLPFVETAAEKQTAERVRAETLASAGETPQPQTAPEPEPDEPEPNRMTGGVVVAPRHPGGKLGPKFTVNWASQSRRNAARNMAERCLRNLAQARSAEKKHGVPALFVLAIFAREASCDFSKNFLNGQPLGQVTTWVPKGYGPFGSWEESVDAAMKRDAYANYGLKKANWSDSAVWAEVAERYNGLGYRNRGLVSPYVWAGFVQYDSQGGKFVRDGVFDRSHFDQQLGVIPLVVAMQEILQERGE